MDLNFDHQTSLSKSKCWYSKTIAYVSYSVLSHCFHFFKRAVPLFGLRLLAADRKGFMTLAAAYQLSQ